jgi:hypothetical protein
MPKQHRKNRVLEKEGVNATRSFFESSGCVFQEVNLENDYGKDAYIDLGDDVSTSSICAGILDTDAEPHEAMPAFANWAASNKMAVRFVKPIDPGERTTTSTTGGVLSASFRPTGASSRRPWLSACASALQRRGQLRRLLLCSRTRILLFFTPPRFPSSIPAG